MKNNIFDLYTGKDYNKENLKATKLIKSAIKRKKWKDVEKLQLRFRKVGADDTASREAIVNYYKKIHKKLPLGFI